MYHPRQHARDKSAYLAYDTIGAIASAVGGAVSIIRISGPRTLEVLNRISKAATRIRENPRTLIRSHLFGLNQLDIIDEALVVYFAGPNSFTGEDVIEFHIHGGATTASRLMETLSDLGVRYALPGEFSFRAVRNGKMSLNYAQAVADLIGCTNETAAKLALEKMSGSQNRYVDSVAQDLRRLAALGEVGIDFSDQDIDEVSLPRLKEGIGPILEKLRSLHQSFDRGHRIQEGIGAVFVGLPNTGKSSLFNALLGEDRSIVSETAGTTRDIVRERLTLRNERFSITLRLEDTAGLRKTRSKIEQEGIERTRKAVRSSDLVLLLLDPTKDFLPLRREWETLGSPTEKTIGLITKSDLADRPLLDQALSNGKSLGMSQWVQTSAVTGLGIQSAIEAILSHCQTLVSRESGEVLLTRSEQALAVKEAIEHLTRAHQSHELSLFSADVRHALFSLGPLIGETLPDDILGQIFSEFCIGK